MERFVRMDLNLKEYIDLETQNPENVNEPNCLEVKTYYHIGGPNYFTFKPETRGYYLSVTPMHAVIMDNRQGESAPVYRECKGYNGESMLLNEVDKHSISGAKEAVKLAETHKDSLIDKVCSEYNLTIKPPEQEQIMNFTLSTGEQLTFDMNDFEI